jgi:hypothetical protein
VATVLTGLDMSAERHSPAQLYRRHDLELIQAQVPGMGGPVRRPCGTEDVGDLE